MSHQLVVSLIAVAANLAGMVALYCVAAHLLARLAWHGRGILTVVVLVIATQLLWMPIALLIADKGEAFRIASYSLWFGNWLVTGFALVLLRRKAEGIPRSLPETARLDGLGFAGTWRHVIFPFAGRDLALLALFTVMATLLPFWAFINLPEASSIIIFQRSQTFAQHLVMMTIGSLAGAIPLIGILLLANRREAS